MGEFETNERPHPPRVLLGILILVGQLAQLAMTSCSSMSPREEVRAPSRPRSPIQVSEPAPSSAVGAEAAEYNEALALYERGDLDSVLERTRSFEARHPRSLILSHMKNLRGLALLLTGRAAESVAQFEAAARLNQAAPGLQQHFLYNLAKAQFDAGSYEGARQTAARIRPELLTRETRLKFRYLKARLLLKQNLPLDAAREILSASRLFGDSPGAFPLSSGAEDTRSTLAALLDQVLDPIASPEELSLLEREYPDAPLTDTVLLRMANQALAAGNREAAEGHLRALTTRFAQSRLYPKAAEMLNSPQVSSAAITLPTEPMKIGLLLPMKGKFAKFGERSLYAIELAMGIFGPSGSVEGRWKDVTLVVEDSGEDADQAVAALNRLVAYHHVIAVIGPLLSKGVDPVSRRADELGIPLISLARTSGAPSPFVFPAGLTLQGQTSEIARYATEKLGLRRFAILYPMDKIGQDTAGYFWDAIEAAGGEITGVESYAPGETDFRQAVDKLSGLFYTEARARELEALSQLRTQDQIKKRNRKTEQYFALKPIVDYQAVFIADEVKVAGQLIPTFAYRDVEGVKFLGTASWNSPEFPERLATDASRSYFADAFFPQSASQETRKYVEDFRSTYDMDPTVIDAIAFDAARLAQAALGRASTRGEFRDRLLQADGMTGPTGKLQYRNGRFEREFKILTVKDGTIVEAP